ncbi:MAG: hypothetical protein OM95_15740 [Bdellovibrio sp. ArHS]|uniref:hypothetical protein n=1 Tax=Bdellovibrio sp. ArHS TaxID=1569284 RepID=UPI0005828D69|nr:hypothetical protein [Bdellovibrio sp. ArHS]KHD87228.1 MAG: hypothetical protein OM95_15740 [Bdellovibrio sp. ArHS]
MIRVFLVLLLLTSLTGFQTFAQESSAESQYDEAREAEIAQKAKKRIYPGGRDEEDLKVQSQLTTPVRKLSPQAEVKEEATEE